jgi:hypothetical protein
MTGAGGVGPTGPTGALTSKDAFRAKLSANQTGIANNVNTRVRFNTKVFDVNNKYDTTNFRWTPHAGPVLIGAGLTFTAGVRTNTSPQVLIYKNGAAIAQNGVETDVSSASTQVMVVDLANGTDYYECYCNASSGATSTIGAVNFVTSFYGAALMG